MYDIYLKYHHIPFGAILDRIRTKEHLSQRELASRSGIPYQRINDFIANRRRISPENSLRLEKALGIDFQCFFYQAQTNYDIYMATKQLLELPSPSRSKFRKTLFWDTDYDALNWQHNCEWIIQRVFDYGNETEIKETIRFYGREKVIGVLRSVNDPWNEKIRNINIKKYLKNGIKN
ncbi:MAG: helix-turn-helix domain-containing protein [Bacteroidales bacterium]|nr:helix-turn-helix domain-containing protein [Bacteroidales bacterium]